MNLVNAAYGQGGISYRFDLQVAGNSCNRYGLVKLQDVRELQEYGQR
jgi:hypothetical protein